MFERAAPALLACLLCAAVAFAAAPRAKLKSFAGLTFGATYEAAQKKLGDEAKTDTDVAASRKAQVKILLKTVDLYGESFSVNFRFAKEDRLSEAYAIAKIPKGDDTACRDRWTRVREKIEAAHGKPDIDDIKLNAPVQSHAQTYKFADGAVLEASLLGCLIQITAIAPGADE